MVAGESFPDGWIDTCQHMTDEADYVGFGGAAANTMVI
jgi:hypothetical protein